MINYTFKNTLYDDVQNEQVEWLKSKHDTVIDWFRKNSYDCSQAMPKNFIIPDKIRKNLLKTYRILFVIGMILYFWF